MHPEDLSQIEEHVEQRLKALFEDAGLQAQLKEAIKPKFWHLNLAQLVTVGTVVVGMIISLTQFHGKLDAVDALAKDTVARVAAIDAGGTQFSKFQTGIDHQQLTAHEQRLQKLEDVNTKLAVIQNQIDGVQRDMSEVKAELKARKPTP